MYYYRLHPQNALGIRQFADTLGCTSLVKSADRYIELCFHEVSLFDEYLNLPINDVKQLLQKNELRIERWNLFLITKLSKLCNVVWF